MRAPAVKIALLALPESAPAAIYGLYEVFCSVGVTWREVTGEAAPARELRPRIVARSAGERMTPLGLPLTAHEAMGDADVVIVSDVAVSLDFDPRGRWPQETAWLRSRHAAGALLCSVCTGALVLAEAGLLDGGIATTHWSAAPIMEAFYPEVQLAPSRILTASDESERLFTSGGASAWEDLALFLVARYSGGPEAVRIAKIFLFGDRSEGQLPYAGARRPRRHEDAVIARCQAWVAEHYDDTSPVAGMVQLSGLTERTFKRRFKAATGYSPLEYVQILRVEEAKQILERTADPVDGVAALVGYEDAAFFRRLFKRRTGVTPARYRRRFAPIARSRGSR